MIVDVHTHTFPDRIAAPTIEKLAQLAHIKPFTDGSNSALLASMAQAGVDRSVVLPVATNIRQVFHVNDSAARLNQDYPRTGVLSLGCLHPDLPQWREELDRIVELGLKGIKLHPVYQDVDFDDPRYLRILERCGELGLVVLTHAGLDVGFPGKVNCTPEMIVLAGMAISAIFSAGLSFFQYIAAIAISIIGCHIFKIYRYRNCDRLARLKFLCLIKCKQVHRCFLDPAIVIGRCIVNLHYFFAASVSCIRNFHIECNRTVRLLNIPDFLCKCCI